MKLQYINAFTKVNPKKTVILLTTTTLLIVLVWQYTLAQLRHFFQFDCQSKESCKIHSRQSRIIKKLILEGRLFHPSNLPYNTSVQVTDTISVLNAPDAFTSYTADTNSFWIEAVIAIETFIPKKDRRYFLEYNAGDGFTHSATLHLEKFLGWTGVLIEPNKTLFEELKHVQRKAFVVNACILAPNSCKLNPGSLASSELKNVKWQQEEEICLALRSILFETNLTSIDLFILKVSKGSLEVLQTIPFKSVNISFFAIEVSGLAEESVISLHMFLYSKKYIFYDRYASRKSIFSMFIEESYYSDEVITKTIREMSPLSYLKIIIGSFDENMDTNILKQFAMSNYLYSLQS